MILKNLRTFAILDYLKEKKYCRVSELMEHFGVSQATIHRDIAWLAARNRIRHLHGGVAYSEECDPGDRMTVLSSTFQDRIDRNRKQKQKISQMAEEEISDGDIVFLDSSTTVFFLAERLLESRYSNLTIITNSVMIVQNFHKFPSHYVLIALGGTYDARMNSFLGQTTLRELERLTVTRAFVSAFGVDGGVVTTNHEMHASLLMKLLEISRSNCLLADASKFKRAGLFRFGSVDQFDRVISG